MDKKYVDHDAIMERIVKIKDDFSPTVRPMFDVFKHILSEAPAADVEPVRHGEWVKTPYVEIRRCSCCNAPINIFKEAHIYCSICGARMDGGNKREVGFCIDPKNYNISQRLTDGGSSNDR